MRHNLRRWAELSAQERGMLIQSFLMLLLIAVGRRVPFRRLQSFLSGRTRLMASMGNPNIKTLDTARKAARIVSIAASLFPIHSSCLDRSLVLWSLLHRRGVRTDLCIGTHKGNGCLEAHAWVEINGMALNDTEDGDHRFSPFPSPITDRNQQG